MKILQSDEKVFLFFFNIFFNIFSFLIDETESEKVKEKILSKCKQYLDRAEKISEYLNR